MFEMWQRWLFTVFFLNLTLSSVLAEDVNCLPNGPIDLSYPYDNTTHRWVNGTPFHYTKEAISSDPTPFYIVKDFETSEHCGTHMDAPYHFNKQGWKIGEIPYKNFFARGVMINASKEAEADHNYALSVSKLIEWETTNGPIPHHSIVLFDFGWARHYSDRNRYFGTTGNDDSQLSFPGLSEEAASWLVRTKKVVGVGTDTLSVDTGNSKDFIAHRVLTAANIFLLENVALMNTCQPSKNFSLIVMPMKLKEGTGAPCRITAVSNIDLVSLILGND